MEAGVCRCDSGDFKPAVFREDTVISRVSHTCCECGAQIPKGTLYVRTSGLWDGSWSDYKTCTACDRIRDDYCGANFGELWEHISYLLGTDYLTGEDLEEERDRMRLRRTVYVRRRSSGFHVDTSGGRLL